MKNFILYTAGITIFVVGVFAALIMKWTITPYGRLHPVMGVLHHLLTLVSTYGIFDRNNLPLVRRLMGMVRPFKPIAGVIDKTIDGPGGSIPIRIYLPDGSGPFPVIVFFHGGGFSIGSIASHENLTRSMARTSSAIVISVGYRLAPEYPFPAAFDDAYAAVKWAQENAMEFNGDPARLAVSGDSAGGNLAAAVSVKARDEEGPSIGLQLLLYPTTILNDMDFTSRKIFSGYVLTEESGNNVMQHYLPDVAERSNPYASPLLAEDHSRLPPAYVMTAAFDPLLDEGLLYAERLREAGVPVIYRNYKRMLHGFMSYDDMVSFFPPLSRLLKEPGYVYIDVAQAIRHWL
jgi:acetyl esterase